MNAPHRLLRFTPAAAARCAVPHARPLLDVIIDAASEPAGQIVVFEPPAGAPSWHYVFSDGHASGLQSSQSRLALETLIVEHYFQDLVASQLRSA